jgi:2'-phosphotransferase
MDQDVKKISKELSYLLRHGALKEGFQIDDKGFVACDELIKKRNMTMSQIKQAVETNDKKRFELEERAPNVFFIRASQGHSMRFLL